MEMPTRYREDFYETVAGPPDEPPRPRSAIVYSMVYPPVGFFPFYDIGNGDYDGWYWPIGREADPPIVAMSSHDAYALSPAHGDLASFARCRLATSAGEGLGSQIEHLLGAAQVPIPTVAMEVEDGLDHRQLLALDPNSPLRNCAVADLDVEAGSLDEAKGYYRRAISRVPEYVGAHYGLGALLRRLRRPAEAAIHFRKALICPMAFYGGSFWADHQLPGKFRNDWARKALMWLQQIDSPHESLAGDPFLAQVQSLTLKTGEARSEDLDRLMPMVDLYVERGNPLDAVYLWMNIGDHAAMETISFRERYGLTSRVYGTRLRDLLAAAGNSRRAALVEDMLGRLAKPDGPHL